MTSLVPQSFIPGYRLQSGTDLNEALANPQWSTTMSLVATTGGTAATSVKIVNTITNVTSATAGAGVTLPRSAIGRFLRITNSTANTIKVYAEGNATINGTAGSIGYSLDAGLSASFYGVDAVAWQTSSTSGSSGSSYVSNVNVALRAVAPTAGGFLDVGGYYVAGDGGGGQFYAVTGAAPGTYVDNTGTIIVPTGGNGSSAWLRIYNGPINVSWFGAKGDGTTNDYLSMYRAMLFATAQGKSLEFVSGKNYFTNNALFPTECSIIGSGATLSGNLQISASNVVVRDLNIISPVAVYAVYVNGAPTALLSNVQLENLNITFSGGTPADREAMVIEDTVDVVVNNCKMDHGVSINRSANYRFTNNVLNGNSSTLNQNELLHASLRSYGIIANNTFLDTYGNWLDIYSSGERTIIDSNRFDGCSAFGGTGFEIKVTLTDNPVNTSGGPNDNGFDQYIIFSNNYVGNFTPRDNNSASVLNIYYLDERAVKVFNWGETPRAIVISGNIFDGVDTTNISGNRINVINLGVCEGVVVSNNIFRNILINGTPAPESACVEVTKCNNIVIANNTMSNKNGSGITLHQECDNIQIIGNQVVKDLGQGTAPNYVCPDYGIYGVKVGSENLAVLTNIIISNNRLEANIASARMLNNSGSVTGMIFSNNNCANETVFEIANSCVFSGNVFAVQTTPVSRFRAFGLGYSGGIVGYNRVMNNTVFSPSGTPRPGLEITRCRASIVAQNTIHTATFGISFIGTNTAGELDYLVVKDNFSVSQTQGNFPAYSSMNADDAATLQIFSSVPIPFTATPNASFTGVIASGTPTKLTTSSVNGTIIIGATLTGAGVPASVTIVSQDSGTTGGAGVYNLSASITGGLTSRQMNTLGAVTFGIINSNQKVT